MASSLAVVSKRYSKALWRLAEGPGQANEWIAPLKNISAMLDSSQDLRVLLQSPSFNFEKKWKVLEEILTLTKTPKPVIQYINYVLKAGRLAALSEITKQFEKLVDESNNTIEAFVESAIALTEIQSKSLIDRLEKFTGKKVRAKISTKPELLAGIRVHMMGRTLDASLTANLGMMQQALLHAEA